MFYKALDAGCIGHGQAPLSEVAPLAAKLGFSGVWLDAGRDFTGSAQALKNLLDHHQLIPAGFSLPLEFRDSADIFHSGLDKLPGRAAYARKLGITRCVTWILPGHDLLRYDANFELHQSRLRQAAEVLQQEGIWLGLEFVAPQTARDSFRHPFIHDLSGVLSLCDAIDTGNCGVLLDAWHWHLAGQGFEDFGLLSDPHQLVCVHVSDAPANIPDTQQNDLVRRLPGTTGIINLPEFFAGLKKTSYNGPVLVEPFEAFLGSIPLEEAAAITKKQLDLVWPT